MKLRSLAFVCVLFSTISAYAAPHTALPSAEKPDRGKGTAALADIHGFKALEGEAKEKAVSDIEAYLSGITSIVADFSQTSSDGSTGDGKFYMKRPGKVRWQYNPPSSLLLVSNGKTLTYYDPGLKQVTYVGVDDTLAGFMAQKTIKLESPTTILTRLDTNDAGLLRATLVQRKKRDEGSLTLEFSIKPLKINKIVTLDATGNETEVTLLNPQYGTMLDDKLFIFNDPRSVHERRLRKN